MSKKNTVFVEFLKKILREKKPSIIVHLCNK